MSLISAIREFFLGPPLQFHHQKTILETIYAQLSNARFAYLLIIVSIISLIAIIIRISRLKKQTGILPFVVCAILIYSGYCLERSFRVGVDMDAENLFKDIMNNGLKKSSLVASPFYDGKMPFISDVSFLTRDTTTNNEQLKRKEEKTPHKPNTGGYSVHENSSPSLENNHKAHIQNDNKSNGENLEDFNGLHSEKAKEQNIEKSNEQDVDAFNRQNIDKLIEQEPEKFNEHEKQKFNRRNGGTLNEPNEEEFNEQNIDKNITQNTGESNDNKKEKFNNGQTSGELNSQNTGKSNEHKKEEFINQNIAGFNPQNSEKSNEQGLESSTNNQTKKENHETFNHYNDEKINRQNEANSNEHDGQKFDKQNIKKSDDLNTEDANEPNKKTASKLSTEDQNQDFNAEKNDRYGGYDELKTKEDSLSSDELSKNKDKHMEIGDSPPLETGLVQTDGPNQKIKKKVEIRIVKPENGKKSDISSQTTSMKDESSKEKENIPDPYLPTVENSTSTPNESEKTKEKKVAFDDTFEQKDFLHILKKNVNKKESVFDG